MQKNNVPFPSMGKVTEGVVPRGEWDYGFYID